MSKPFNRTQGPEAGPAARWDLSYPLRWRVRGVYPGAHRGSGSGSWGTLRGFVPFHRSPDARRLDLRRSLRDPFGQWYVRDYEPRIAATVYALVDVSASMGAGQDGGKIGLAAQLCALLAQSAHRNGDAFGLYACGTRIERDLSFPARRSAVSAGRIAQQLASMTPSARGADGLSQAAAELAGRRKLVFLISDLMFPANQLRDVLTQLSQHDVVPVVLDEQSLTDVPSWGLAELVDAESGQKRLVVLRPSVRRRWMADATQRAAAQDRLCARLACRPFRVGRELDVAGLSEYLLER